MNRGWQKDSYRHSLAAKGISTKYYAAKLRVMSEEEKQDYRTISSLDKNDPLVNKLENKWAHEFTKSEVTEIKKEAIKAMKKEKSTFVAAGESWKFKGRFKGTVDDIMYNVEINDLYAPYSKKVDLNKYAGTWEQESVTPTPPFQKGLKDVKAEYTVKKDGSVKVVNTGITEEGKVKRIEGTATPVTGDNRKLEVQFGKSPLARLFMRGDYNIKKVNKEYTEATVEGGGYTWKLKRPEKRSYKATYVPADIPLIAADGVGTVGASAVAVAPLAVAATMLYGGAVLGKKAYKTAKEGKK